jgi:hypothetical protein
MAKAVYYTRIGYPLFSDASTTPFEVPGGSFEGSKRTLDFTSEYSCYIDENEFIKWMKDSADEYMRMSPI